MAKCKKCNKEIPSGKLCEHCKAVKNDKLKTALKISAASVVSLAIAIVSNGKINPPSTKM